MTKQQRGVAFEHFLKEMLDQAGAQPRTAYRPTGEEIDGSFIFRGQIFLLEAKWHANTLPASTIYAFKGKVDGKLIGTIGVFISMSGYSKDTVEALRAGKTLNVILMDRGDIEAAVRHGFNSIMSFKLRAAAEEGELFVPYVSAVEFSQPRHLAIIVEGYRDVVVLKILTQRLLDGGEILRPLSIYPASGRMGIPKIARVLSGMESGDVLAILDGDENSRTVEDWFKRETDGYSVNAIVVQEDMQSWATGKIPGAHRLPVSDITRLASTVDIQELIRSDAAFRRLHSLLTETA
ncbi:restriction endonuclease [Streptacidiphilus sp. PAMC 29251]